MSDYPTLPTVLDHLLTAGIAPHHAARHLRYGRVRVNGRPVTDPHAVLPARATVVLRGVTT